MENGPLIMKISMLLLISQKFSWLSISATEDIHVITRDVHVDT